MLVIFNLESMEDPAFYKLSRIEEPCYGVLAVKRNENFLFTWETEVKKCEKYFEGEVILLKRWKDLYSHLRKIARSRLLHVNFSRISKKLADELEKKFILRDVSRKLRNLLSIKDESEIRKIERAVKIAEHVFKVVKKKLEPGVKEIEIAAIIKYEITRLGAFPSFEPIVAYGKNATDIHHTPSEKKLEENEPVLIDLGARYRLYCSDLTRTFFWYEVPQKAREVFEVLEELASQLEPGKRLADLQELAEKKLGRLKHAIGHGIGLSVHEAPNLREKLKQNMVVAIEPGVYEGFGVRFEDNFVVGGARLSKVEPDELILD